MSDGKRCAGCGAANATDARYCWRCGTPLPDASQKRRGGEEEASGKGHLFDRSWESVRARACLVVLILGVLILFGSQNAINQTSNYAWASYFVDEYGEAMSNYYLGAVVGIVMAIGGGVGLIQFFVRKR